MSYCTRCGESLEAHAGCDRTGRPGTSLDPPRFCAVCGAKMTVQVEPTRFTASCLRCERRGRFLAGEVRVA